MSSTCQKFDQRYRQHVQCTYALWYEQTECTCQCLPISSHVHNRRVGWACMRTCRHVSETCEQATMCEPVINLVTPYMCTEIVSRQPLNWAMLCNVNHTRRSLVSIPDMSVLKIWIHMHSTNESTCATIAIKKPSIRYQVQTIHVSTNLTINHVTSRQDMLNYTSDLEVCTCVCTGQYKNTWDANTVHTCNRHTQVNMSMCLRIECHVLPKRTWHVGRVPCDNVYKSVYMWSVLTRMHTHDGLLVKHRCKYLYMCLVTLCIEYISVRLHTHEITTTMQLHD